MADTQTEGEVEAPKHNLSIYGVGIHIPERYAAEHVVNAAEASVLNQTMRENLGNNLRAEVLKLLGVEKPADVQDSHRTEAADAIQTLFDEKAPGYNFGVRVGGARGPRYTPLQKEAREIARRTVDAIAARDGVELSKEKREANITRLSENDKIVAQAKKNLAAVEKAAEQGFELEV